MKDFMTFKRKWKLTISLILFIFVFMMLVLIMLAVIISILIYSDIIKFQNYEGIHLLRNNFFNLLFMLCVLLGMALTVFFTNKALKPLCKVIDAIHKVSQGDFNVQVDLKGIGELEELSQSFNKMTYELSSIETLRKDFVNNFSHEFKTPIVSMRGFAKLLKDGELKEEERQEYLDIIIAESERLVELSTNVLNMSKYENVKIITGRSCFRLDEQIRRVILLMEPKWTGKDLLINIELEEILFNGNEEFTQQIWINLLDNAIKFSNSGGTVDINMVHSDNGILFTIKDNGPGMDNQTILRIFDKFYQGDTSHSISGNGLGLSIVKRITNLCGGTIRVESEPGTGSSFAVFLPDEKTDAKFV
jgi:signal transduction histidine kinase